MLVFLVATGCYSDYYICGAFSSRDRAQEYINTCIAGLGSEPRILEYELDEPKEQWPGGYTAHVTEAGFVTLSEWDPAQRMGPAQVWYPDWAGRPRVFFGVGKTQEHARRSAEELRRATIAETVVQEVGNGE